MWNAIGSFFQGDAPPPSSGNAMRGGFSSMANRGAQGNFKASLVVFPSSFLENKEYINEGDKIILPHSVLAALSLRNVAWPMTFKLENPYTQRVIHAGVQEFSAEEGTCYLPHWMMQNLLLRDNDIIQLENVTLAKGGVVKLQPCSKTFLEVDDHRSFLERSLNKFTCLTKGELLPITYKTITYEIEVLELTPGPAICIIECDLKVEFAPPKDWTEEDEQPQQPEIEVPAVSPDGTPLDPFPWLKTLVNGVRNYDEGFNRLVQEGRVPGVIRDRKLTETAHAKKAFTGTGSALGSKN